MQYSRPTVVPVNLLRCVSISVVFKKTPHFFPYIYIVILAELLLTPGPNPWEGDKTMTQGP